MNSVCEFFFTQEATNNEIRVVSDWFVLLFWIWMIRTFVREYLGCL